MKLTQAGVDVTPAQCEGSNPSSFAEVFREYQRPIYNYLLRMTLHPAEAEDLTQETFIRVHRGLPRFRGEARLSTWLYRIATNVAFEHLRRRSVQQAQAALPLDEAQQHGDWIREALPLPEELAAHSEMAACVRDFIRHLPDTYRAVLVLHDLQGFKNREIAAILDCSLATAKIRLHRAREKLRTALKAGCDFAYDERNVFVCAPKEERKE